MAPKAPLNTVVLKNRSSRPMIMKRARSGMEYPINPLGAVGLKVYKVDGFISIDWESHTVWVDVGDEN